MKPSKNLLYWAPRIIGILTILLISMFALDSFNPGNTTGQNLASLLIHLLPSFALLILLLIAWKWEFIGGIIFIVLGIAWGIFVFYINYHRTGSPGKSLFVVLTLSIPLIIAGILFIFSHNKAKKQDKR
jgi:prolipoprotein diacylglyceryltransferase